MGIISDIGEYSLLMKKTFTKPERWKLFFRQMSNELEKQGLQSIPITLIISFFIGAVITIQMRLNTENPLLPDYLTGYATRETMILEFSSTILCLILAGKVGSSIASEIGTMRITEQIDALEVMGINSANYLILPKIVAFVLVIPFLVILSISIGLSGGLFVSFIGVMPPSDYLTGIQFAFIPYYVFYTIIKSFFFAFIIASCSSFYGYYAHGGALDVGKASTTAVVNSSIVILFFNLLLTNLLLV